MTNFGLMYHHKYSLNDVNNMIPFERDLYIDLINTYQDKKRQETG